MGRRRTGTTREITLEEYASFQETLDDCHGLTAELLNQVRSNSLSFRSLIVVDYSRHDLHDRLLRRLSELLKEISTV